MIKEKEIVRYKGKFAKVVYVWRNKLVLIKQKQSILEVKYDTVKRVKNV